MGAVMIGTFLWCIKYYTVPRTVPKRFTTQKPTQTTKYQRKPGKHGSSKKPFKQPTKTPLSSPVKNPNLINNPVEDAYVGNGWWSSNLYFGWEPNSYAGLKWGTGASLGSPFGSLNYGGFEGGVGQFGNGQDGDGGKPEKGSKPGKPKDESANWLKDFQQLFVEGNKAGTKKDNAVGAWVFATTTVHGDLSSTTTEGFDDGVYVPVPKDHLKPPPGGWGVDYDPNTYFAG